MTAFELQAEYQDLVGIIANKDYETLSKAVKALRKVLTPPGRAKIAKAALAIDPRIAAMTKGIKAPASFDYKEQRHSDYWQS